MLLTENRKQALVSDSHPIRRDRVYTALGGTLSIIGGLLLAISGTSLVRVLTLLAVPAQRLPGDLNMTVLATICMAVGTCILVHGLRLARDQRGLPLFSKFGVASGGLLAAMAAALMFTAFDRLERALNEVLTSQAGPPPPEIVAALMNQGRVQFSAGLFALLSAEVLLGISLWALFWAEPLKDEAPSKVAPSATISAILASGGFAWCFAWAARHGLLAWNVRFGGGEAGGTVAGHIFSLCTYAKLGCGFLCIAGLMVGALGAMFRVDRTP